MKIKDISDGNSHLWHHNYSLPFTKVLSFYVVELNKRFLVLVQMSVIGVM